MGQVGEFSFILASSATALGIVDEGFLSLTVASAVVTMALTPWILSGGERAINAMSRRFSLLHPYRLGSEKSEERQPPLRGHVVVCGLGRTGSLVVQALSDHKISFIVIDLNPRVVALSRAQGHFAIHGESGSEMVLEAARVKFARLMVIGTADPISTRVTAQQALHMNPDLDIVARVRWREEGEELQRLGIREVVWPEMEAGLEMIRHSLQRYRASRSEVDLQVSRLRERLSFGTTPEVEGGLTSEDLGEERNTMTVDP